MDIGDATGREATGRIDRPGGLAPRTPSPVLAVLLAMVAGFVDGHLYLHLTPVFVANMSGNLIRIGMFSTGSAWPEAVRAGVAVVSFVIGVLVVGVLGRRMHRGGPARAGRLLFVESALIVTASLWMEIGDLGFSREVRFADLPVVALAAVAMGVQTEAMRRTGHLAVITTFETGTLVRVGERLVSAPADDDDETSRRRWDGLRVLVAVVLGYVAGAVVSALVGASHLVLLGPAVVLVVVATVVAATEERVRPSSDAAGRVLYGVRSEDGADPEDHRPRRRR